MCRPRLTVMDWIYHTVRDLLNSWGYWAVALGLFAESAGVPVPGETVLMFASFLAHKDSCLSLPWVIFTGIATSVMGDNLGFLLGHHFGRTLIRWVRKLLHLEKEDIDVARELLRRHGGRTVFFARFIFGLRTIFGPLAGSLGMEWRQFLKFNMLGATTWVTAVALVGYAFANEFDTLLGYMEKGSWAIAGGLFALGYLLWRRRKSEFRKRHHEPASSRSH